MSSGSVFKAIKDEKCPRCHRGNLFITSVLDISGFYKMNRHCPVCEQAFEPEPGFYYGAMFISYVMLVIMSILTWITLFFTFHPAFEVYVVVILLLNVLLLPFIFRYSRTLYLFGFGGIGFNEEFLNKKI
jgi:uncharacterized protein (DUF983 family)